MGFVWKHNTMDSQTAVDTSSVSFLSIQESVLVAAIFLRLLGSFRILSQGDALGLFERLMKRAQN